MGHWQPNCLIGFHKAREMDNSISALHVHIATTHGWSYAQSNDNRIFIGESASEIMYTETSLTHSSFSHYGFKMSEAVFESMEDL